MNWEEGIEWLCSQVILIQGGRNGCHTDSQKQRNKTPSGQSENLHWSSHLTGGIKTGDLVHCAVSITLLSLHRLGCLPEFSVLPSSLCTWVFPHWKQGLDNPLCGRVARTLPSPARSASSWNGPLLRAKEKPTVQSYTALQEQLYLLQLACSWTCHHRVMLMGKS